jgi:hypothetical protein
MVPRLGAMTVFLLVLIGSSCPAAVIDGGISPDASVGEQDTEPLPPIETPKLPVAREPSFQLTVQPQAADIGDVISWNLHVRHRVGDRVHLSSGADFDSLEVRSKEIVPGLVEGDWTTEILKVELVGFVPGDVLIPAQKLNVVDVDGNIGEFTTPESGVTIKSLIANEPEPALKIDQGPGEKVFEQDYTLLWILGALAAAGIIALLTLLGRWLWSKRKPKAEPPPPPPRPAEDIALEKLESLKRSSLLEQGLVKEFHVRLSETIREYLGGRYHFDSLELSSEELIAALRGSSITADELNETLDFLSDTDLIKFAKVIPTLEESQQLLGNSFIFIKKTTPQQVVATPKNSSVSRDEQPDA